MYKFTAQVVHKLGNDELTSYFRGNSIKEIMSSIFDSNIFASPTEENIISMHIIKNN